MCALVCNVLGVYQCISSLFDPVCHPCVQKTPLQSFKMDIEFLRNVINSLARNATSTTPPQPQLESQVQAQSQSDHLLTNAESLLQSLTANTEFMAMAVNRGIEFAKASGGIKLVPAMASFNLNDALLMPLKLMESVQSESTIGMEPLPSSIHPQIITDLHWLRENVLCLVSNALKYSDNGTAVVLIVDLVTKSQLQAHCSMHGDDVIKTTPSSDTLDLTDAAAAGTGAVTATAPAPASAPAAAAEDIPNPSLFVRITIIDGGIGIPEHSRQMLFKPFQQAQRLAGGTGLGLFSLSQRMEALHGHCGVESRPDAGRGSAFWFAFPYTPDRMTDDATSGSGSGQISGTTTPPVTLGASVGVAGVPGVAVGSSAGGAVQTRPLRILVVDDSLSILKVTGRGITQAGHVCETAQNGSIALERLQRALSTGEIDMVSGRVQ